MRKQHNQTTKPKSLLQKSRLERYLELLTRTMWKCFHYSIMSFLLSKKPLFGKATSSNDKSKVSFTEKQTWKTFRNFDQNHGLTPFKVCKFINFSYSVLVSSKKPPFEKTTSSNDKTKVSFPVKEAPKIFVIFSLNPFQNMEMFRL